MSNSSGSSLRPWNPTTIVSVCVTLHDKHTLSIRVNEYHLIVYTGVKWTKLWTFELPLKTFKVKFFFSGQVNVVFSWHLPCEIYITIQFIIYLYRLHLIICVNVVFLLTILEQLPKFPSFTRPHGNSVALSHTFADLISVTEARSAHFCATWSDWKEMRLQCNWDSSVAFRIYSLQHPRHQSVELQSCICWGFLWLNLQ